MSKERRDTARLLFRQCRVALDGQRLRHGRQRRRSVACKANTYPISKTFSDSDITNHTELRRP